MAVRPAVVPTAVFPATSAVGSAAGQIPTGDKFFGPWLEPRLATPPTAHLRSVRRGRPGAGRSLEAALVPATGVTLDGLLQQLDPRLSVVRDALASEEVFGAVAARPPPASVTTGRTFPIGFRMDRLSCDAPPSTGQCVYSAKHSGPRPVLAKPGPSLPTFFAGWGLAFGAGGAAAEPRAAQGSAIHHFPPSQSDPGICHAPLGSIRT